MSGFYLVFVLISVLLLIVPMIVKLKEGFLLNTYSALHENLDLERNKLAAYFWIIDFARKLAVFIVICSTENTPQLLSIIFINTSVSFLCFLLKPGWRRPCTFIAFQIPLAQPPVHRERNYALCYFASVRGFSSRHK